MDTIDVQDKCRGSLVGGAIGDALGYPVEFVGSFEQIRAKYGDGGIKAYDLDYPWLVKRNDEALFSDDTQMTLYTAEGIIQSANSGEPLLPAIREAYLAWFGPQMGKKVKISYDSKLAKIDELNQLRAPGNTCLSALNSIYCGNEAFNASKGCGGIMRVAPIGIYGATHGWSLEKTGKIAGDVAEITHKHKMSTFSSAVQAMVIQSCLLADGIVDADAFKGFVDKALGLLPAMYPGHDELLLEFTELIKKSINEEQSPLADWQVIEYGLGEGWVAEETLAIALFSVVRHIGDFKGCMACAVNHGGDSDSTGAVAGNIIGAMLGYDALPAEFTDPLQLRALLVSTADALVRLP